MEQIASLALEESQLLEGFKVGGLIPFRLSYIRVSTHIKLCVLREQIKKIVTGGEMEDFLNPEIQAKLTPVLFNYIVTGLLNDRKFGWLLRPFLRAKVKGLSYAHLCGLYMGIQKMGEPAFFLVICKGMTATPNTILREVEPSSDNSSPTKKKQD